MAGHQEQEPTQESTPLERPIECGSCKKDIVVKYSEIIGHQITCTGMCDGCPVLERRLRGTPSQDKEWKAIDGKTGLACGNCGTTLEALRTGSHLGCSECYEVFGDVIISELVKDCKVPQRVGTTKKTTPLHIGRAPGESQEINPSLRLLALNEALRETLKREDYEQAALLRDQIQELTTEGDEQHDEG